MCHRSGRVYTCKEQQKPLESWVRDEVLWSEDTGFHCQNKSRWQYKSDHWQVTIFVFSL